MTNEELVLKIKEGIDTAENTDLLYEQNKNYIYKLAKRYSGYVDIDDLLQEGYFGLCNAIEKYDPYTGIKFLTYAEYRFKQAMQRYIENNRNVVRLPAHLNSKIHQCNKFINFYYSKYGIKPSAREISSHLHISEKQVEKLKEHMIMGQIGSLDNPITGEDDEICMGDIILGADNIEDTVIENFYNKQLKEDLWKLVSDVLEEKEKSILESRYKDSMTLKEISAKHGVTIEAIRQYESRYMKKLRNGKRAREFRNKYESEMCYAWRGTLSRFKTTWTSSTEQAAMKLMEL